MRQEGQVGRVRQVGGNTFGAGALVAGICVLAVFLPALPGLPALRALPARPALPGSPTLSSLPAPPGLPAQPAGAEAGQSRAAGRRGRLFPPTDLGLLEAPDRDQWQKPDLIMDALKIGEGDDVADIGAGGGWFTVRLARRVYPTGTVYAQDIQPIMLEVITRMAQRERLNNVRTVLGTPTDPKLPPNLDAVLIVDAYHEMDERPEVMLALLQNITSALKPQGRLGIVDFLPGDGGPGPAAEERIDPDAVIRTLEAAGMRLQAREPVPPFQFLLVFGKAAPEGRRRS